MAYVDIPALKRSVVDQLEPLMPLTPDGKQIPFDYAHPGIDHQKMAHVWLFGARCLSVPSTQSAGRKRRDQTWSLTIQIEAIDPGPVVDATARNIGQQRVDALVMEIAGIIDEWVAEYPTLGQTYDYSVPVEWAQVDSITLEEGVRDNGSAAACQVVISARIRPK